MTQADSTPRRSMMVYDEWMESIGVPIHRGHYQSDLRTVELGWWEERGCNAAFLQMKGMEGVSEARIVEIPPGVTLPPLKMAIGETVYVLSGSGLATIWAGDGPKTSFEWGPHAMFHVPRYATARLANARGDQPARLLHYNYMPMAMTVVPDPDFFFKNTYEEPGLLYGQGRTCIRGRQRPCSERARSTGPPRRRARRGMRACPPPPTAGPPGSATSSRTWRRGTSSRRSGGGEPAEGPSTCASRIRT